MFKIFTKGLLLAMVIAGTGQAQFTQPGDIDTTFNFGRPHSFFTNPTNPQPGEGASLARVRPIAQQPDGKLVIGGNFTTYNGAIRNRLARLNADESLDNTFNPGTWASGGLFASTNSMALKLDGRLVIGGQFTVYDGIFRPRIARVFSPGVITG